MSNQSFPNAGCCLLSILYFPIGVIMELAKSYGGSSKKTPQMVIREVVYL